MSRPRPSFTTSPPPHASTSRGDPTTRGTARKRRAPVEDYSANLSTEQIEGLRRQSNLSTLSLSPRRPGTALSGSTATTRPRRTPGFHQGDESSYIIDGEDEAESNFTLVDRMRNWRNDAMTQHLYGTAEFWGSKVFGLTGNADDAFWLAQTHFLTHQYGQAERILTTLRPPHPSSPSTSATPAGRLTDTSLACRYLAAQCQVRLGKWEEALEMVGRRSTLGSDSSGEDRGDGGIRLTASTAHLRGLIHLHLGAADLAKEAFIEALSRDVKCFESFQVLVGSEMMSSAEEWEFIQGLPYLAQTGEDADFVRMMYTVRLKKIAHHDEMAVARQRLTDDHGLGEDPDVMFGLADELYSSMRFAECYKLTSKILAVHSSHRPTLPIHLACMHHLPHLRSRLFLLAHELVESDPDDAISWYGVGLWYFSGRRWEESRRFFGKSVLIDSRFGPAWLAFAHSYAFEGEHDQAITAYSTALRHSQGSHLPLLFIGMQQLGLMNLTLAEEYLNTAKSICNEDPLATNELGVVAVHAGRYEEAILLFKETLRLAQGVEGSPAAWATTHLNLGHAYRKLKQLPEAHACFRRVIQLDPRSAAAYSALGLIEHQMEQYQESIARYHEALSISPGDPITCDLLKLVLDDVATHISSRKLPFPGLPPSALANIDESVAALDREIMAGVEPRIDRLVEGMEEEDEEEEGEGEGQTMEGETMEGETMEGDSQSMDVSASMDMTIE